MTTGRHTGGLADGVKVANVPIDELHRSIVSGVAAALRDGVPVVPLDGWSAHRTLSTRVIFNEHKARLTHLRGQHAHERAQARRLREMAGTEPDPDVAADLMSDVRRHTRRAKELASEIEQMELAVDSTRPLEPQFEGEVEYIVSGVSALLAPGGRVSKEERQAFDQVFKSFTLAPENGYVRWSLELLLPADGRVFTLGPVTGRVGVSGRAATPAEVRARGTSRGAAAARRRVRHDLEKAGFPAHLARSVPLEPTGLLARVLLGQDVAWPGCADGVDQARFTDHVRDSWPRDLHWARGVYAQTNPSRQVLADLVAALGGSARLDQVMVFAQYFSLRANHVYAMTLPHFGRGHTKWPPTVDRTGDWSAATGQSASTMRNPTCPRCGLPVTAVVRVPEVPDALLCRGCRVMPSRPDLVFPPQYLDLALPPTAIPTELLETARGLAPGLTRKGPKPKVRQN